MLPVGFSTLRHGEARRGHKTPEYNTWTGIRKRCHNPKDHLYPYYGGRGIFMCEAWRASYEKFVQDVGRKPGPEFSLDRKDNERGYEPGNVRWATDAEQRRNKRSNVYATLNGETRILKDWAELYGVPYKRVHQRVRVHGWSLERALTAPARGKSGADVVGR